MLIELIIIIVIDLLFKIW